MKWACRSPTRSLTGAVIQASSQIALDAGTTFSGVLEIVAEAALGVPVVLFGYLNPFLAAGEGALDRIVKAGCDGLLITDLPVGADPPLEGSLYGQPACIHPTRRTNHSG